MAAFYTEADYENSVIELFQNMGYEHVYGPNIERDFRSLLYDEILEDSLYRINKGIPKDTIKEALFQLYHFEKGELVQKNAIFMEYLQSGMLVRYFEKSEERSTIVYNGYFELLPEIKTDITLEWQGKVIIIDTNWQYISDFYICKK